ncbi:MAG TPA: HlyD family secretion protein [Polyangiaceae bacterium]|nr:HlyD family secretion protein [Polyangiaceae bacterium]
MSAPIETNAPNTTEATPKSGRRPRILLIAGVTLAAALAGSGWWLAQRGIETTEDAQIDADVVPVPARAGGTVLGIHFTDNQRVPAGALLVELDPAPAEAKLAQAEAELAAAEASARAAEATAALADTNAKAGKQIARASLNGASIAVTATGEQIAEAEAALRAAKTLREKARLDLERAQALATSGSIASATLDAARAAFDTADASVTQSAAHISALHASTSQAKARVGEAAARLGQADDVETQIAEAKAKAAAAAARVATAVAARDLARLELSYTKIFAPRAGIASKRSVAIGQLAATGQTLLMLVPTDSVWVTGNFKETQLAHMHAGQPAHFTIDAYAGQELHGIVESFSGATGARFALLPPDNATGNFTKVVQRVPVRIKITEFPQNLVLRPGLSVELSVDTKS